MEREDSHPEPFEVEEAATPEGDSDEEKPEKESEQKEKRIYFLQHRFILVFKDVCLNILLNYFVNECAYLDLLPCLRCSWRHTAPINPPR